MGSTKLDSVSMADNGVSRSRREALKRFGRYAAAAPAAMILLQPNEGHAGQRRGGRPRPRRRGSPY
jgi:hypothetical protein